MKKILAIICAVFIVITLFSCKKSREGLKTINGETVFTLGLDDSFPPLGYRDNKGNIIGFDIDVAKEVTKRLGFKLDLRPISWDAKEIELVAGNIDCIWNGFTATEQRAKVMSFTSPYLKNQQVFVVRKSSGFKAGDKTQLKNKKIGVQASSSGQIAFEKDPLFKKTKQVVEYKSFLNALLDLRSGAIDAVVIDSIVANTHMQAASNTNELIVLENVSLASEDYVVAFAKRNEVLRKEIEDMLAALKEDGTLKTISEKWFGKDLIAY